MVTQFQKYFENPRQLIIDWRRRQTQLMREALADRLPDGIKIENLIHDDVAEEAGRPTTPEKRVRRLYSNRLAFNACARIEGQLKARQFFISLSALAALILISGIVFSAGLHRTLGVIVAFYCAGLSLTVIGGYLLWLAVGGSPAVYRLALPSWPILTSSDLDDATAFARRALLRDDPVDTPADLDDVYRPLTVDAEAKPVDGQVVTSDFYVSWIRNLLQVHCQIIGAIGLVLMISGAFSQIGIGPLILAAMTPVMLVVTGYLAIRMFTKTDAVDRRAIEAKVALNQSPTAALLKRNKSVFERFEEARGSQIKKAIADKSPVFTLGTSLGVLTERSDPFAPSRAGMPMQVSLDSLSRHMGVIGKSGSGKTATIIRPFIKFWFEATKGGMLVLDGKGALPREIDGIPGYTLLSPENINLPLMKNLDPSEVAALLLDNFGSKDAKDPIWQQSAHDIIQSTASMLALLVDCEEPGWRWCLSDLHRMIFSPESIQSVKDFYERGAKAQMPLRLQLAYFDFTSDFPGLAEDTRTSIKKTVASWLNPMLTHPVLSVWAEADEGVEIEDVLYGARFGMHLPECPAGAAIAKIAKQRLYNAVKKRGKFWPTMPGHTSVLMVVDECHLLLSKSHDSEMLSIARELGLCGIFATQDVEGLLNAFDGDESLMITTLAKMVNFIALQVNTPASYKIVSERIGSAPQVAIHEMPAMQSDAAGTAKRLDWNAGGFKPGTIIEQEMHSPDYAELSSTGLASEVWMVVRQLAGKFGMNEAYKMLPAALSEKGTSGTVKIGSQLIVEPEEVSYLTANEFTAFADIYRGGSPRRDLIQLSPMFAFDKEVA